jgi:SMODS and SLOG-associating 2TM effector domain family 5
MTNEQSAFGGTLRFKIWVTRGCYYALSDRLKRKARYSVGAIMLLSFYVVVNSLVTLVFGNKLPNYYPTILSTLSIVLSIFIIIITLLEDSKRYVLDGDHAWQTARALEALFNRYEIALVTPPPDDGKFQTEYGDILHNAHLSRRAIDYHLFQLSNPRVFELNWYRGPMTAIIFLMEMVVEYGIYLLMTIGPLIVMGLIVYVTMKHN